MQVESVEQAEAIRRLRKAQRVQRLLEIAKGPSWLHGRYLFLVQIAFGVALLAVLGRDAPPVAVGLFLVVGTLAVAIVESLGRRIDAVLELLELNGGLAHGAEHVVTASTAAEEGARR